MTHNQLTTLIHQGEIQELLRILLDFVDKHYTRFASEIYLISSRYNQVLKEKRLGIIPISDYKLEINSITKNLLEIVNSLEGFEESNFKKKKSKEQVLDAISELDARFNLSRTKMKTIQSNPTRLREKNEIARELGEIFINHPELIQNFHKTTSEGIITGIANRYKRVPELSGIDFFETVASKDLGNFTKCSIVNALAEIIYTGQLMVGDDQRISKILDQLFQSSFQTVKLSITRVSGELDYFLGNVLSEK